MRLRGAVLFLLFVLFLILPGAYSEQDMHEFIGVNEVVEWQSWNITIKNIYSNGDSVFKVESNSTEKLIREVPFNETIGILGINVTSTDFLFNNNAEFSFLTYTTNLRWRHRCNSNSDCDDFDPCTMDYCVEEKYRGCGWEDSHIEMTKCVGGDNCCPSNCDWLEDNDCAKYECEDVSDCDDGNFSTTAECVRGECIFSEITRCLSGDNYCPNNCSSTVNSYENNYDRDCSKNSTCVAHSDCNDLVGSTKDICWGENNSTGKKRCYYRSSESTASFQNNTEQKRIGYLCVNAGQRSEIVGVGEVFCSTNKTWEVQKDAGEICAHNYSCKNFQCTNGSCYVEFASEDRLRNILLVLSSVIVLVFSSFLLLNKYLFNVNS